MNLKFITFFCFTFFLKASIAQFVHHQSFTWDPVYNNALIPADTDGDGDIDFITSSDYSGPRLIEKIGDDLYERPVYLTDEVSSYSEHKLIDLEGDGMPDFIGMRGAVGQIVSFKNLGENEFSATPIYDPGGVLLYDLWVADIDGDGDQDITFRVGEIAIYWLENDGAGDFSLNTIFTDGIWIDDYINFDGDGDGDLDVCIHEFGASTLSYSENLGGTFATPIILTDEAPMIARIISFDYDADGDNDLIYSLPAETRLLENLGDAAFSDPITFATYVAGAYLFPFTDIDGDGLKDFVARNSGTNAVSWKKNLGAGIFEATETMMIIAGPGIVAEFKDIDLDGKEDLVHLAYAGDMVYYKNLGDGEFSETIYFSETIVAPFWTYAFDVDNDGDQDLFGLSHWDNRIAWIENLGSGDFSEIRTAVHEYFLSPFQISSSDIDGDGLEDLLGVSFSDRSFWVKNMGDGTFGDIEVISDEPCTPTSIIGNDWDGDGDNDVMVGVASGFFIKLYENVDGIISPTGITLASDFLNNAISSHDLDGDGDLDILYASNSENTIKWLENTGDLSFISHSIGDDIIEFIGQNGASDMDGDGDLDIMLVSAPDNMVAWIENLGDGLFGGTEVLTTACLNPITVSHADINDDGIGDLIVGSIVDDIISWFPGLSADEAEFGSRNILSDSAHGVHSLIIEDLDLDGDNDIVYIAHDDWVWSWFENRHIIDETGISENDDSEISVYPNPFSDILTVKFVDEVSAEHTIVIYDILGTEIYRLTNITAGQIQISKKDIGAGLYFLSVFNADAKRVLTTKLIAE